MPLHAIGSHAGEKWNFYLYEHTWFVCIYLYLTNSEPFMGKKSDVHISPNHGIRACKQFSLSFGKRTRKIGTSEKVKSAELEEYCACYKNIFED